MAETLKQFIDRMSVVEKDEELQVGPRHSGHSRAVFNFEKQFCYLESVGYFIPPRGTHLMARVAMAMKPTTDYWWTDFEAFGSGRCKKIASHYGGEMQETFYGEDGWFHFVFDEFEQLMALVYDRHTGEFERLFGKEPIQEVGVA